MHCPSPGSDALAATYLQNLYGTIEGLGLLAQADQLLTLHSKSPAHRLYMLACPVALRLHQALADCVNAICCCSGQLALTLCPCH